MKKRQQSKVRVYRGEPFQPTTKVEEVTAPTIRNRARRRRGRQATFALTRDQRAELSQGRSPRITVPHGQSPFAPGDIYNLPGSSRLWLGITGIEEGKEEDTLLYVLHDDKPRLLRASPHGVDFEAIRRSFDSRGNPQPLRDPEAVSQAAEESAYTTSPGASLRLEKEAVSREVQAGLTRESHEDRRFRRRQQIVQAEAVLTQLAGDPDFAGEASDIRYMQQKLVRWQEEEDRDAA